MDIIKILRKSNGEEETGEGRERVGKESEIKSQRIKLTLMVRKLILCTANERAGKLDREFTPGKYTRNVAGGGGGGNEWNCEKSLFLCVTIAAAAKPGREKQRAWRNANRKNCATFPCQTECNPSGKEMQPT